MKERKLRRGVNWKGVLKQKDAKQKGVKQGLGVFEFFLSASPCSHLPLRGP